MKNKFKLVIVIVIVMVCAAIAAPALPALAQDYGLKATAGAAGLKKAEPAAVIGSIIGYALSFIGIIFLCLLIYGGALWMTSFGNEQKVKTAKELITGAVIGLVIILAAYAITHFVIGALVTTTPAPPS